MTANLKFEQILDSAFFIIIGILLQRYINTSILLTIKSKVCSIVSY